eukprot:gene251-464_t
MIDVDYFFTGPSLSDEVLCIDKFIGDEVCSQLAVRLKDDTTKKRMILRGNCIGPAGAQSLSKMLAVNKFIDFVSLEWNEVGSPGVAFLASSLETNTVLTSLDLRNNGITNDGAILLANVLNKNHTLKFLDLRWNQIGDAGGKSFELPLTTRPTKLNLLLGGNLLSPSVNAIIEEHTQSSEELSQYTNGAGMASNGISSPLPPSQINKSFSSSSSPHSTPHTIVTTSSLDGSSDHIRDDSTHSTGKYTTNKGASHIRIIELEQLLAREKYRAEQTAESLKLAKTRINDQAGEINKLKSRWELERAQITEEVNRMAQENQEEYQVLTAEKNVLSTSLREAQEEVELCREHISYLQDEMNLISRKVVDLESKDQTCQSVIIDKIAEIERLTMNLDMAHCEVDDCRSSLTEKFEQEKQRILYEMESIKDNCVEIATVETREEEWSKFNGILESKTLAWELEKAELMEEIKTKTNNLVDLEEQMNITVMSSEELITKLHHEIMQLMEKNTDSETELNDEINRLKTELDSQRVDSQRVILNTTVTAEVEIQSLKELIEDLSERNKSREKDMIVETELLRQSFENDVKTLRKEIEDLDCTCKDREDQINNLKELIETNRNDAKNIQEQLIIETEFLKQSFENDVKTLRKEIEDLNYTCKDREDQINNLKELIETNRNDAKNIQDQLIIETEFLKQSFENDVKTLRKEIEDLDCTCKDREDKIQSLRALIEDLSEKNKTREEELIAEVNLIRASAIEETREFKVYNSEIDKAHKVEVIKLTTQLSDKDYEIENFQTDIINLTNDLKLKIEQFRDLERECSVLKDILSHNAEKMKEKDVEICRIREDYIVKEKKSNELISLLQSTLNVSREEMAKTLQEERHKYETELVRIEGEMEQKIKVLKTSNDLNVQEMEKVQSELESTRRELSETVEEAISHTEEQLHRRHQIVLEDIRETLRTIQIDSLNKDIVDLNIQIKHIRSENEKALQKAEYDLNQTGALIRLEESRKYDGIIDGFRSSHLKDIQRLQTTWEEEKMEFMDKLEILGAVTTERDSLLIQINNTESKMSEIITKMHEQDMLHKERTDTMVTVHNTVVEDLNIVQLKDQIESKIKLLERTNSINEELQSTKQELDIVQQQLVTTKQELQTQNEENNIFHTALVSIQSDCLNKETELIKTTSEIHQLQLELDSSRFGYHELQGKITELNKQLMSMKLEYNKLLNETMPLSIENAISCTRIEYDEKYKNIIQEMKEEIHSASSGSYEIQLQQLTLQWDMERKQLQETISSIEIDHQKSIDGMVSKSTSDLKILRQSWENERNTLTSTVSERVHNLEEKVRLSVLERDQARDRATMADDRSSNLNNLLNVAQSLNKEQKNEIDILTSELKQVELELAQVTSEKNGVGKVHIEELEAVKSLLQRIQVQHQATIFNLQAEHAAIELSLRNKNETLSMELYNMEQGHIEQSDKMIKDHNDQMEQLLSEMLLSEQTSKDHIDRLLSNSTNTDKKYTDQINELQTKLSLTIEGNHEQIERLKEAYDKADKQHKKQLESLQLELTNTTMSYEQEKTKLEQDYKSKIENLILEKSQLEVQYRIDLDKLKKENGDLNTMSQYLLVLEKQKESKFEELISERMDVALNQQKQKHEIEIKTLQHKYDECMKTKTVLEERCEQLNTVMESTLSGESSYKSTLEEYKKRLEYFSILEKDLKESVVTLTLQNAQYVAQLRSLQSPTKP